MPKQKIASYTEKSNLQAALLLVATQEHILSGKRAIGISDQGDMRCPMNFMAFGNLGNGEKPTHRAVTIAFRAMDSVARDYDYVGYEDVNDLEWDEGIKEDDEAVLDDIDEAIRRVKLGMIKL